MVAVSAVPSSWRSIAGEVGERDVAVDAAYFFTKNKTAEQHGGKKKLGEAISKVLLLFFHNGLSVKNEIREDSRAMNVVGSRTIPHGCLLLFFASKNDKN